MITLVTSFKVGERCFCLSHSKEFYSRVDGLHICLNCLKLYKKVGNKFVIYNQSF